MFKVFIDGLFLWYSSDTSEIEASENESVEISAKKVCRRLLLICKIFHSLFRLDTGIRNSVKYFISCLERL